MATTSMDVACGSSSSSSPVPEDSVDVHMSSPPASVKQGAGAGASASKASPTEDTSDVYEDPENSDSSDNAESSSAGSRLEIAEESNEVEDKPMIYLQEATGTEERGTNTDPTQIKIIEITQVKQSASPKKVPARDDSDIEEDQASEEEEEEAPGAGEAHGVDLRELQREHLHEVEHLADDIEANEAELMQRMFNTVQQIGLALPGNAAALHPVQFQLMPARRVPPNALDVCPACHQDLTLTEVGVISCGHFLCLSCIREILRSTRACPKCFFRMENISEKYVKMRFGPFP